MKVEMTVDWDNQPNNRKQQTNAQPAEPPRSLAERRLWYIALGRHIDDMIDTGQADSLADIARMCCVSRARVSQIFASPDRR